MRGKYFYFEKDPDGRWYVILPEWTGDRDELEMVMGADTMLDIISQGENMVSFMISLEHFKGSTYELSFTKPEEGGAWYDLKSVYGTEFPVWLCHVTKFVFGHLPLKMYIG